jgi:hypothetical protein
MPGVGTSRVPEDTTATCHSTMSASGKPAPSAMARRRSVTLACKPFTYGMNFVVIALSMFGSSRTCFFSYMSCA